MAAEPTQLDPVARAVGHLEGRFDGLEKRLESLERLMLWGFGITWTLILASGVLSRVWR